MLTFATPTDLTKHKKKHKTHHQCSKCSSFFPSQDKRDDHNKTCVKPSWRMNWYCEDGKPYQCQVSGCNTSTSCHRYAKNHAAIHDKRYKCDLCKDHEYPELSALNKHKQKHGIATLPMEPQRSFTIMRMMNTNLTNVIYAEMQLLIETLSQNINR